MNPTQIQENLEELVKNYSSDEFIYDLLRSYGLAKASITRLKKGEYNLSDNGEEVIWKNKVYYKEVGSDRLHDVIDELSTNKKVRSHDLRFIIVTDHDRLLAEDTKTKENRDITIEDLPKHFDFFLPWAGMEKRQHINENPADVKAAEKLAKLFDEIKKNNTTETDDEVHSLNVFLSRLLFCFFAEDTGIFEENLFTNSVSSHTKEDGSDLNQYFEKLFAILNDKERKDTAAYLNEFPYVNGGLFQEHHPAPEFNRKSRQIVIECGELDWAAINPDIFGSMMQAVITPDQREGLGIHYTSVPNIMKVIEPLFLNDLYDEFEKNKFKPKKLHKLLDRISKFKIFDPACGSGNFLVIAYKQLRYFEIKVLKQLQKLQEATNSLDSPQKELIPQSQLSLASSHQLPLFSRIQLSQFYGIEIDDFAHEIAQLSLWLAEHQMNLKFYNEFGNSNPTLPLKEIGNIICENAVRIEWESICPKENDEEIYILGNPPYSGFRNWDKKQKEEMKDTFKEVGKVKRLDYIACWFKKATDYLDKDNIKYAFVSTNSICQGEQVSLLWPYIFSNQKEIFFAHKPFDWRNNAKSNASVTCIIVGISNKTDNNNKKYIYTRNRKIEAKKISPYLVPGIETIVYQRKKTLTDFFPTMKLGSSGIDGGNLMLSKEEKNEFIKDDALAEKFIKPFLSGGDFLNGNERYCLWINDDEVKEAKSVNKIADRIKKCKEYRLQGGRDARKGAKVPHRFFYRKYKDTDLIIVPRTSSGRRDYIPCGFLSSGTIVSNQAFVIYDSTPTLFGILSSRLHCLWMSITSGKMRHDYSYSVNLTYNTFPFPDINKKQRDIINEKVLKIISIREKNSQKTLAELYDPDKMPGDLVEAHHQNDMFIESCYQEKGFNNDEERLEVLFELYEKMIQEEN